MTLNSFIVNCSEFLLLAARCLAVIHTRGYLTRRSKCVNQLEVFPNESN